MFGLIVTIDGFKNMYIVHDLGSVMDWIQEEVTNQLQQKNGKISFSLDTKVLEPEERYNLCVFITTSNLVHEQKKVLLSVGKPGSSFGPTSCGFGMENWEHWYLFFKK